MTAGGNHGSDQAPDRGVTAASIGPRAAAAATARGLVGGRLRVPGRERVLDRPEQPVRPVRAARASVVADDHDRLRGLRGRDRGEPPARRARVGLVWPACGDASRPGHRRCRGGGFPGLEITGRPARRPGAHRPGPRRCPSHRHGVHHRPGRRPRRCRHAPSRDRGHHREHRRPGLRSADRRPARPLRAARTHAPVHRLPRRADRRGGRGDPGARGPPGRSSPAQVPPAAAHRAGERTAAVRRGHRPGRSPRSRSAGCSPGWPERSWPGPCTSPRPRLPGWRSS